MKNDLISRYSEIYNNLLKAYKNNKLHPRWKIIYLDECKNAMSIFSDVELLQQTEDEQPKILYKT